jgi:hypothetical protein
MNKGFVSIPVLLMGLIFGLITTCTTTGGQTKHMEQTGTDVFASKNWNAPQRNNMYDLENEQEDTKHSAVEHTFSGGHHIGALPEDTVMFTHVR